MSEAKKTKVKTSLGKKKVTLIPKDYKDPFRSKTDLKEIESYFNFEDFDDADWYEHIFVYPNDVECILTYENGKLKHEMWFKDGMEHRDQETGDEEPRFISYNSKGVRTDEEWYFEGIPFRKGNKPSKIYFDCRGIEKSEHFTSREGKDLFEIQYSKGFVSEIVLNAKCKGLKEVLSILKEIERTDSNVT